ncbi:unnamed protein product [Cuscuta campestris]|uniref:Uncharacterized protein n=1 Tax=Cuscuta campestris TaxID=132261 RepID=A0A484KNQ2_9ASTE|nr:unnamed protein product [Cuscuta campestris]VFQ66248.1 unnamed protein product [Cuscuta campestris]
MVIGATSALLKCDDEAEMKKCALHLLVLSHSCYQELFQHHVQAREGYVGTPCWCLSLAESPSPVSFFARSFLET